MEPNLVLALPLDYKIRVMLYIGVRGSYSETYIRRTEARISHFGVLLTF